MTVQTHTRDRCTIKSIFWRQSIAFTHRDAPSITEPHAVVGVGANTDKHVLGLASSEIPDVDFYEDR